MKSKLIIDGLPLLTTLTGVGRYTFEISRHLQGFSEMDLYFYYGYISRKLIGAEDTDRLKLIKKIADKIPPIKKIILKFNHIYKYVNPRSFDLYWQPNFIPIESIKSKKVVTTIHDFSFIHYPDFHPRKRIEYFRENFFTNIKRSDSIITVSEYIKQEILDRLSFSEDQISVIYHGIRHDIFKPMVNPSPGIEIPRKFILFVGSIEPRKNLFNLLKAYSLLSKELKSEYKLLLVGFQGWQNSEIMAEINKNKEYIHYAGYVTDQQLSAIYNLATCFIFPSYYEGFGLPPVEAMACGAPVIVSRAGPMPEVCGDAALYIDPYSVDDIKETLEDLLCSEKKQEDLSKAGLQRARMFNWSKSAEAHRQVFNKLIFA